MAPGGVVRIAVPDLEQCIEAYTRMIAFLCQPSRNVELVARKHERLEDFLAYAGAGAEPAYLFEAHKYGYDFETLAKVLGDAGFERVSGSDYMASDDPALRVDDVSAVAKPDTANALFLVRRCQRACGTPPPPPLPLLEFILKSILWLSGPRIAGDRAYRSARRSGTLDT